MSKIMTEEIALEIYSRLKKNETVKDLAKEYEISESTIISIKNGWHWIYKKQNLEPIKIDEEILKQRRSLLRSGENNGMYGKKHSEKSIKKISKNRSGIESQFKGISRTEEVKKKVSEGVKKAYKEGRLVSPLTNKGNSQEITSAELLLSKYLLPLGFKQEFIVPTGKQSGPYRLDFALESIKLDIEADGAQHYKEKKIIERDKIRDEYLKSKGWLVIRFKNEDILNNIDRVISEIRQHL